MEIRTSPSSRESRSGRAKASSVGSSKPPRPSASSSPRASGSSDGPSISSDGTQIAFRSTANLGGGNADANQEVFLWRSAGPTTTQITATTGGSSDGVSLAADGSRMAFKSSRDLTGANSDLTNEIFAWDETGGITQLTDAPIGVGCNRAPLIAGNGSSISF